MRSWAVLMPVATVLSLVGFVVQPASACGCGAMVSRNPLQVAGELAIVRWDGSTEQIVLRLAIESQAPDAALVFPTPTAATVTLGERGWFRQLQTLTAPRDHIERDWWPGWNGRRHGSGGAPIAAAPPGVRVLSEQRLGSLVVATLDATDAGALSAWLREHGYALRPELAAALQVYVRQRWKYVAVKLAPQQGQAGATLQGQLDPLHISFAASRPVYPMYISHLARTTQRVHLWVVAPHRVRRVDPDVDRLPGQVQFAGPVSGVGGSLGSFIGRGQWLTEFDDVIYQPDRITADWQFAFGADRPYRQTHTVYRPIYILGVPGGWFAVGVVLAGGLALTLLIVFVRATRHRRPSTRGMKG